MKINSYDLNIIFILYFNYGFLYSEYRCSCREDLIEGKCMFLYFFGRGVFFVIVFFRGFDGINFGRWSNNVNRFDRGYGGVIESGVCEKCNIVFCNIGVYVVLG